LCRFSSQELRRSSEVPQPLYHDDFAHYADEHPLFTYALYSPRTKRIVHRQDVVFLTSVFPMRHAREGTGLGPEGDQLLVFRSPPSMRVGCDADLSFGNWGVTDDLPLYDDGVTSFELSQPYDDLLEYPVEGNSIPVDVPNHPSFPPSGVVVPIRSRPNVFCESDPVDSEVHAFSVGEIQASNPTMNSAINASSVGKFQASDLFPSEGLAFSDPVTRPSRRPTSQRWTYESVVPAVPPTSLGKRQSKSPQRLGLVVASFSSAPSGEGPASMSDGSGSGLSGGRRSIQRPRGITRFFLGPISAVAPSS
jgi:hypothetical protein